MNDNTIKLLTGILFAAGWLGLLIHPLANDGEFIDFCKAGLIGLGCYHFGSKRGAPAAPTFPPQ